MINALLNGILNIIQKLLNLFLLPINLLFENLFPDMTNQIQTFNNFVSTYLGNNLSYFFNLFPPIFKNILFIWFTYLIGYYSMIFTYKASIKIFNIIRKVKFW